MEKRYLTGNWKLKKRFFGGYDVYVEVHSHCFNLRTKSNLSEEYEESSYVKATKKDLENLNIRVQ